MPDVTIDKLPYLFEVGTVEKTIALSPNRFYTIYHTGKDSAGAASIGDVFANMQDAAVTTTYANGEGKVAIQSGRSFPVPVGADTIRLKTASGNVSLQFVASDYVDRTPTSPDL